MQKPINAFLAKYGTENTVDLNKVCRVKLIRDSDELVKVKLCFPIDILVFFIR